MKRKPSIFATILLLAGFTGSAALGSGTPATPVVVSLNGMISLFGSNLAMFHMGQTAASMPADFSLAEGESKFNIKLLSVDFQTHSALIDNGGQKQTIHICDAPVLASGVPTVAQNQRTGVVSAGISPGGININFNPGADGGEVTASRVAGNQPGVATGGPGIAGGVPSTGAGNGSANGASSGSGGDLAPVICAPVTGGSQMGDGTALPWWYPAAQKIEQARADSAAAVLAGAADPQPLTPLTPTGTDPGLIGSEKVYFSYHNLHPPPAPPPELAWASE